MDGASLDGRKSTVDSMFSVAQKCLRMRINPGNLDLTSLGLLGRKLCRDMVMGRVGISAGERQRVSWYKALVKVHGLRKKEGKKGTTYPIEMV